MLDLRTRAVLAIIAATLPLLAHTPALAATFTTTARGDGCEAADSGPVSSSAACPTAFATSAGGHIGVFAGSRANRPQVGPLVATGSAQATAFFQDTIFFGVDVGTLTIPVDFNGTAFTQISRGLPETGGARIQLSASGGFGLAAATGDADRVRFSYSLTTSDTSAGSSTTEAGAKSSVQSITLPFSGGSLSVSGGLRADATCLDVGQATLCVADMDYSSSLRLLGGTLRDVNGNVLSGIPVTSESGFDYLAGVAPHDPPAVVPLPPTLPLLIGALAFLGIGRRIRRGRACL